MQLFANIVFQQSIADHDQDAARTVVPARLNIHDHSDLDEK